MEASPTPNGLAYIGALFSAAEEPVYFAGNRTEPNRLVDYNVVADEDRAKYSARKRQIIKPNPYGANRRINCGGSVTPKGHGQAPGAGNPGG